MSFAEHKVVFDLNGQKEEGHTNIKCMDVAMYLLDNPTKSKNVKISQFEGTDDWGVKTLHIQKYPDSVEYEIYALDENEPRFWTDGDENNCHGRTAHDSYPCCPNGQWCDLVKVTGNIPIA